MCEIVFDYDNWEKVKIIYIIVKIIVDGKECILRLKNEIGMYVEKVLIWKLNELNVLDVILFMNNFFCY